MRRFPVLACAALVGLLMPLAVHRQVAAAPADFQALPPASPPAMAASRSHPATTGRLVVELAGAPDLGSARAVPRWEERGRRVADALRAWAESSARATLDLARQAPGVRATPFWIRNQVVVEGATDALRDQLARLPGVRQVRPERTYHIEHPVAPKAVLTAAAGTPEWGVAKIGADQAWNQGALGGGVVVATIDSGVDYLHPALVQQYRGNLGGGRFDHNYNWLDAAHACPTAEPCDLVGHGTHTMGTILGGDGPGPFTPDIGVAPAAKWITASCGATFCTESQILDAAQFVLEPYGDAAHPPDPAKRPQIVSNSWGAEKGNDPFVLDLVRAWRAAGIIPVFSAGNFGPACSTVTSPGDYDESFAVGATGPDDVIADFSGRGPTTSGKNKPDIVAPGVDVVSAAPGGGYATLSGTSMAAPHVAGALALALGASPGLDPAAALAAVSRTAISHPDTSCGGAPGGDPNGVYGEGRVDAAAAVREVATGGTIAGRVTDATTGAALAGTRIEAVGGGRTLASISATDGRFRLALPAGTWAVRAQAFGYGDGARPDTVVTVGQTTTVDLALAAAPSFAVSGTVTSAESGQALAGVKVEALGTPRSVVTDAGGRYLLSLPAGSYRLRAARGGCTAPATVDLTVGPAATRDFRLEGKTDKAGHGCSPVPYEWTAATTKLDLTGDDAYGKLALPFAMPWYGKSYRQVFVSTNGFLSFVDPQYSPYFNDPIPSEWDPNGGIYPLWQNLSVEGSASITTASSGVGANASVVVSFNDLRVVGTNATVRFQVRLWANGAVDLIYADTAGAQDGLDATIGIESPDGKDALQFSYKERSLSPQTAWRYAEAATATVKGTVVDANDNRAVAKATVTAQPGGRSVVTDAQGRYQLKLAPGSYRLDVAARRYQTGSLSVQPRQGQTLTLDNVRLKAPVATITPASLSATVPNGQTVERTVTVSNTGSAPLHWSLDDREALAASPWWRPAPAPPMATVVTDPAKDALGPEDVVDVSASATPQTLSVAITFTPESNMDLVLGLLMLDVDQNPDTGSPAPAQGGKSNHDIGVDYVVNLFGLHYAKPQVDVFKADGNTSLGTGTGRIDGHTVRFEVPVRLLGTGEDGNVDFVFLAGYPMGPSDWAPDAGHGTIETRHDADWVAETPASGELAPGASTTVTVRLGSPTLSAGAHQADVRLDTDAPRVPKKSVPVRVTVNR